MKKNLTFKLGLFCAALVLVSTCFITNAWARYTKTVTATDSANVAKFDVTFNENETTIENNTAINIFGTKLTNIIANESNENKVDTNKIIAPGSYGSFTINVSNKSQVKVELLLSGTISLSKTLDGITDDNLPIKFYLGSEPTDDSQYVKMSEIKLPDNTTLDATNGSTANEKNITIYWKWIADETTTNEIDTKLGLAANAGLVVTANITLVVNQVLTTGPIA